MARPTASGSVFLVAFALAVGLGYSCGDTVPLEELDCPCLTVGYVCCKGKCMKADAACTDTDGAAGAGGSGHGRQLEHRWHVRQRWHLGTGGVSGSGGTAVAAARAAAVAERQRRNRRHGRRPPHRPPRRQRADRRSLDAHVRAERPLRTHRRGGGLDRQGTDRLGRPGRPDNVPLATGSRYNPATNSWTVMATLRSPTARFDHRAVWTGTEMIVWGGRDGSYESLDGGARYNPATDTWTPMARPSNVLPRARHQAVWSGTQMLVWGGINSPRGRAAPARRPAPGGGRYDPATDSWKTIATEGAPPPPRGHPRSGPAANCCYSGGPWPTSRPAPPRRCWAPWACTIPPRTAGGR